MKETYKEVRKERTGWRDNKLDELLVKHGMEQPNSFLVTEYNYGKSVAVIEYKHISWDSSPDQRLINYCDLRKNREYYFIILFDYEKLKTKPTYRMKNFVIRPGNASATEFLKLHYSDQAQVTLTELEFILFLYKIRDNESSKYYKQAVIEYQEWFDLELRYSPTYDISKNVISARHRTYAYDVPAADIDCIVCDKENVPYLFIEYKANHNFKSSIDHGHNHFISINMSSATNSLNEKAKTKLWNQALIDLGDGCHTPIPVMAVEYNLENKIFSLYAFNTHANDIVTLGTMSQEEYFKYIKEPSNFIKKKAKVKTAKTTKSDLTCPRCNKELELKNGKNGKFYGCTGFKINSCRYTKDYKE